MTESEKQHDAKVRDEAKAKAAGRELSDAELDGVAGGVKQDPGNPGDGSGGETKKP